MKQIIKKESHISELMTKAINDPDYKKFLELIKSRSSEQINYMDYVIDLVREKLSKTVTIDNFSCKPTGWYWEYTKEQQEEYFNKVFEKLVIANTPANDYELKRYFNYTYIDLILCLVISKFYHKNNFDIYGDLYNKYYYGVEEVLKDEYLEDNIIVNKTKMIVDLYYNKRGFNWKIERLVRFGVKDEYKVKYIRSILTEESIPEIMLKYIDIEDLSLVKPYDIELDI